MGVYWILSLFLAVLTVSTGGCNPVQFTGDSQACANQGGSCVVNPQGTFNLDYEERASAPMVDILIVDDNSASMSFEQKRLSQRFVNFINSLEARTIDYRIAITTTDIQSSDNLARPINGNGSLQNGSLIPFADGSRYLSRQSGDLMTKVSLFDKAIVRPETLKCESFIINYLNTHGVSSMDSPEYQNSYSENCPSGDERGIYAANLVVQNNPNGFLRSGANLAIIILADEDERSQYYDPFYAVSGYGLEAKDIPANLVKSLLARDAKKKLTVHSIIVRDATCQSQQGTQLPNHVVSSSYGIKYADLSRMTGGVTGDICANDQTYTQQIGTIAGSIATQVQTLVLKCSSPENFNLTVKQGINPGYDLVGNEVRFKAQLTANAIVHLSYTCQAL